MNKFYTYLLQVETNTRFFPMDRTLWERFCFWFLRNVFGARYWHDVVLIQAHFIKAERIKYKAELKKLQDELSRKVKTPL